MHGSGAPYEVDPALRLTREAARDLLAGARMALHEDALEMDAEVGGLTIGTLVLGIASITRTNAASFAQDGDLGRRTIATLAQIGYDAAPLPTRLFLDARGWVYAEVVLERVYPVARSWRELVARARADGGVQRGDQHGLVAELGGWHPDDLAAALDLATATLPTGHRRVAWDREAATVCFSRTGAVASTSSLADLARMVADAQTLEPATTIALLDETPGTTGQMPVRPLVDVPTTTAQRLVFHDDGTGTRWTLVEPEPR